MCVWGGVESPVESIAMDDTIAFPIQVLHCTHCNSSYTRVVLFIAFSYGIHSKYKVTISTIRGLSLLIGNLSPSYSARAVSNDFDYGNFALIHLDKD